MIVLWKSLQRDILMIILIQFLVFLLSSLLLFFIFVFVFFLFFFSFFFFLCFFFSFLFLFFSFSFLFPFFSFLQFLFFPYYLRKCGCCIYLCICNNYACYRFTQQKYCQKNHNRAGLFCIYKIFLIQNVIIKIHKTTNQHQISTKQNKTNQTNFFLKKKAKQKQTNNKNRIK